MWAPGYSPPASTPSKETLQAVADMHALVRGSLGMCGKMVTLFDGSEGHVTYKQG